MLEGLIAKIATTLLNKLVSFAVSFLKKQHKIKTIKTEIDEHVDAVEKAVSSIEERVKDGKRPTAQQERDLRDAARRLNGNFL